MKKLFGRGKKKKSASETGGSIASGMTGSGYNISPKKDLGKLHKAAFDGDLTKLKSLLKRGDVNQLDKENRTPLHLACASGKYEVVTMLADHHNINLNLCDNDRRSALMKCVQCEHQKCLNILLEKEADVSLCDINDNTALHIAASIPNPDICYLLSDYHADAWAKNKDGATPLHIVAGLGSDQLVSYFLEAGVRIDDKDNNKKTPLMYAAHKGHLSTVKLLLSRHANSALRDSNGWTADDYASMDGYHPISHVIVEHNVKQNVRATPSRQSLSSSTHTTPQRLSSPGGVSQQQNYMPTLGGPALDVGDDLSHSDDSQSVSRRSHPKDSWGSSESEEEPVYAKVNKKKQQEKPKINLMQAMNLKKKSPALAVTPGKDSAAATTAQPMAKATTNLFMTSSARQQIAKQESEENEKSERLEDQGMRERYDSKSARGLPVSPAKPPLPKPRSASVDSTDGAGYPASAEQKRSGDEESDWDSSEEEGEVEQHKPVAAKRSVQSPDKKVLMGQLGFDEDDVKGLYGKDETDTDLSEALPARNTENKTAPRAGNPSATKTTKKTANESDSWDDDTDSEQKPGNAQQSAFNFISKSSAMKFDDETDSESEFEKTPGDQKPSLTRPVRVPTPKNEDADSSSYNSDNFITRPEDAPAGFNYVSSTPSVLKDAEKLVSPQRQPLKSPSKKEQEEIRRKKMEDLGIVYGEEDSDADESDFESESSWEKEKRSKKALPMNNQRDLEKERIRKEKERKLEEEKKKGERDEEEKRKKAMEERLRREQEEEEEREREMKERRKKQRDEEEKRKRELEEKQKRERDEEEKRKKEMEELEKLNRMNEELERKNAELRRKMEEDKRKQEEKQEEEKHLASFKTSPMNESLRTALERAVEVTSDSGDSNPDSFGVNERKRVDVTGSGKFEYVKNSFDSPVDTSPAKMSMPSPSSRNGTVPRDTSVRRLGVKSHELDFEALSETEDELSISENHRPPTLHTTALSDSLKLAEEKQSLSMQLAQQQDLASDTQERLEKLQKDNKQLKMRERMFTEEKKTWELTKVDLNSEKRKLSSEVKNLQEGLETVSLKLSNQEERCKRMEEQVKVERDEKRELEITIRDLRTDLKSSNAVAKQLELDRDEMKKVWKNEQEGKSLASQMDTDSFKLNRTLEDEKAKLDKIESLEQDVLEKNQELLRLKAERDRFEDTSNRYKDELSKLRSQTSDQHSNIAELNEELNEKLDEKEAELRESEEALQLAAFQSVQIKQAYEKCVLELSEAKRQREGGLKDLEMLQTQKAQLKSELEDSRASLLREQERSRKHEESLEKMRDKESDLQARLLSAETKANRYENDVGVAQSYNKQRVEEAAKLENECGKLRQEMRETEKTLLKLQRENAEQSGKIEALKIELHQRESECMLVRQEKEDLRSRSSLSVADQQEKFNLKLAAIQREHENERVAFETRNTQLTEQVEHWKSEAGRIEREKVQKDDELAHAQQDRIEAHKKLGYADAFSKSASKEQQHLMEDNTKFKEDNIRLQSQVSLLEQKLDEKSTTVAELQKEVDRYYQTSANATRQIDSLNESQRLTESSRIKLEDQLKEVELENIRLKSELESANSWKERLQQGREEEAHAKAVLEEKLSALSCDKLLAEEKVAAEIANAKMLHSEADGHRTMWEAEVKARSKAAVDLSRAENELEEEKRRMEALKDKLARALEERKTFKTKYEQMKRNKLETDKRAESYRSDDLKKSRFENEKLKEELRRLRAHVESSYVDRSELEAARQEERIKAQAALTPTLDQVNSYLKDRQLAQDMVDQLRQKNEENRFIQAMRKIGSLEEELASLRRRSNDGENRRAYQQEADISRLYDSAKKENEVLQHQLLRAKGRADEYKASLVKEKRKFHTFFSNTLGGSFLPNGDVSHLAMTNGLGPSPSAPALTSTPLPGGVFSSTPKKDNSDPLLAQLRSKLDVSISNHLASNRAAPSSLNFNGHGGGMTPGSSAGTPRSDRSSHPQLSTEDVPGTSRHKPTSNEYMSFLIS